MGTFSRNFWISIGCFVAAITIICFMPYWFTSRSWFDLDFKGTGPIGDTIGGIMGPFIAIIAAILTFIAFWVQYQANLMQAAQFNDQADDTAIERFENKFYNLVEIHRNNANEVKIGTSTEGRKAFISMFNELKFTYCLITDFYNKNHKKTFPKDDFSDELLYNIAYLIFFFGVGQNSSPMVKDLIDKKYHGFFLNVEEYIKKHQNLWREERKKNKTIGVNFSGGVFELDIKYMPCNGHMSKLSHYIRNLFQLIKFIDDADEQLIPYEDKYNYATTIRSQLSVHEQLLVYYNAVSVLGQPWLLDDNYLKKYCLVKSIPLPIADFYKRPNELLGMVNDRGKVLFEWGDIKERLT